MANLRRYQTYCETKVGCGYWRYYKFYIKYDDGEFRLIE
jgi:hypothetical protein